jgi:16S rRNA (cytosine967-C5)-methyltransferase
VTGSPVAARRPPPRRRGTARGVALEILEAVDGGARANELVATRLDSSGLESRDRALVTELVYGTTRMRRACDWLVDRHTRGRTDAAVRAAMRMGAYQLGWLRVPAHAAVSATVAEVAGPGRSVVNAVLRRVADELDAGPVAWPDPATELSYPDWIVERLSADLGPTAAAGAMATMNLPATATRRDDGYIQDRASQLVASYVGAGPGERILDLCAAPGGKATAIARSVGPSGLVVAGDLSSSRTRTLSANMGRLGPLDLVAVVADGRRPPWRPASFDRVLVDAPCSGLGVLRRRPDARWRVQPGDVTRLARLQRSLLRSAMTCCAPGGVLVYSVCTLTRSETSEADRWLAGSHPDWTSLPPPPAPWQPSGRGALLLPQTEGTDGMYVIALLAPERLAGPGHR